MVDHFRTFVFDMGSTGYSYGLLIRLWSECRNLKLTPTHASKRLMFGPREYLTSH